MLGPRFQIVARRRPVALVAARPGAVVRRVDGADGCDVPLPLPAPYAAVQAELTTSGPGVLTLRIEGAGGVALLGRYDAARARLGLVVTDARGRTTRHRSRRHGRCAAPPDAVALTLTGTWLTVWSREAGAWVARGRAVLRDRLDVHDEAFCHSLTAGLRWAGPGRSPATALTAGTFGQLGLRDLRFVTSADGTAVLEDGRWLLTATSAGPGFFDTGHTSVWALDDASFELQHRADLFFRRPDRAGVYGDHATHLLRDQGRWLVATSTWGDFRRGRAHATVAATLAESDADLTVGSHVLDTRRLALPTDGLRSVGVWDPHLVRDGDSWLVGFVTATRFFRFHPAVASGPDLESLTLRAVASDRRATEGTTVVPLPQGWRVLASDGRDGRPGQRQRFPVFDLDLTEVGTVNALYPTNLPWPTLARRDDGWLMVTFNGQGYGGPLPGYGTHGDVVMMTAPGADFLAREPASGVDAATDRFSRS